MNKTIFNRLNLFLFFDCLFYIKTIMFLCALLFYMQILCLFSENDYFLIDNLFAKIYVFLQINVLLLFYNHCLFFIFSREHFTKEFYKAHFYMCYFLIFTIINFDVFFKMNITWFKSESLLFLFSILVPIVFCLVLYFTRFNNLEAEAFRLSSVVVMNVIQTIQINYNQYILLHSAIAILWFCNLAPKVFVYFLSTINNNNITETILLFVVYLKEFLQDINKFFYVKFAYFFFFIAYPLALTYFMLLDINYILTFIVILFNIYLFVNVSYVFYISSPEKTLKILFKWTRGDETLLLLKISKIISNDEKFLVIKEKGWCVSEYFLTINAFVSRWAREHRELLEDVFKKNFGIEFFRKEEIQALMDSLIEVEKFGTIKSAINYSKSIDLIIENNSGGNSHKEELLLLLFYLQEAENSLNEQYELLEKFWFLLIVDLKKDLLAANAFTFESAFFKAPQTYNVISRLIISV